MRLQLILRKIAILVGLTAGLAITSQASAIDVDKAVLLADRNFANCTKKVYEYTLKACSLVEDMASSWACGLSAVKFYLHQGNIVEYMSNEKYNTGQL